MSNMFIYERRDKKDFKLKKREGDSFRDVKVGEIIDFYKDSKRTQGKVIKIESNRVEIELIKEVRNAKKK